MTTLQSATTKSRQTLRFAVLTAALGVAGMFTAAASFAGSDAQASEAATVTAAAQD